MDCCYFGYTKLLGDAHVQLKSNHYLIIRCGHKTKPFIYDKAFEDVIGNFDYVDKIVELIIKLINDNIKNNEFNLTLKLAKKYTNDIDFYSHLTHKLPKQSENNENAQRDA